MFRLLLCSSFLLFAACAIQSAPEGGPKDEDAPAILSAQPENKSTNFSAKEIVLTFNEYVQVVNFGNQFFSSPPLEKRIDMRLKGKKLYLTLEEDLRPNTTYTFSFGNAIQDITEGNVQADFKYVFSTGDVLDSLRIGGLATDAFTGLPEEKAIAMLYPAHLADTSLVKQKPSYYALTNASGQFLIENLAADTFQVIVVKDVNMNLLLDENVDKVGFVGVPTPSGTQLDQPIRMFYPSTAPMFINAGQKGFGRIALTFSQPVKNLEVGIVGGELFEGKREMALLEKNSRGDTVQFWYNPLEYPDNLNFLFLNLKADSLKQDSVRVLLQKAQAPKISISPVTVAKPGPADTLLLRTSVPILSINQERISVAIDSVPVTFDLALRNPRLLALYFPKKPGKSFEILFQNEALTDLFGRFCDSTALKNVVALEDEKAIVKFRITAVDDRPKVFELLQGSKAIKRMPFTNSLNFDLGYVEPGKYGIRIIWDDNQNMRWDVGDFGTRQQPEPVMYYPKPIELRANWEMDVVWEVPVP